MRNILFLLSFFIFAPAFLEAKPRIFIPSATIPRNLSAGKFYVQIMVKGLTATDLAHPEGESEYYQRINIYLDNDSYNLPYKGIVSETSETAKFEITPDNETIEVDSDTGTTTITYDYTIEETQANYLSDYLKDSTTIKITAFWDEDGDEKNSVEFTATKSTSVANDVPKSISIKASYHSLISTWAATDSIIYSDSKTAEPSGMVMFVTEAGQGLIQIDGKVFSDQAEDTESSECTINTDIINGASCVSCNKNNSYIDLEKLNGDQIKTAVVTSGNSAVVSDLDINKNYVIFLAYMPDSLQRSNCYLETPADNFSLSEYYKEAPAKKGNPACFIATAAYGTSYNKKLNLLRWFRDNYLITNPIGLRFVKFYYKYSPPIAKIIRQHPFLAELVRLSLWLPSKFIELLKKHESS